jgi:hypothetical protein
VNDHLDEVIEETGDEARRSGLNSRLFLSAVFLPLITAIGAVFVLVQITKTVIPELFLPHAASFLEIFLGITGLLFTLTLGFCIGTVLFVILWRPFVPREVLERIVTEPKTPIFSNLLMRIFAQVYLDKADIDSN